MKASITKKQRNEFFALCKKLGIGNEERKHLIHQYSGQYSIAEGTPMTERQMWQLLTWLRKQKPQYSEQKQEEEQQLKAKRSQVLKHASKLFPELENPNHPKRFERFNQFLLFKSVYKKRLDKHSLQELEKVKRQLIQMQKNNAKAADNKEATEAVGSMLEKLGMYSKE